MNQGPKIYLARAGRSGKDEDRALEQNIAIVGFHEVPSLATATDYKGVHEVLTRAFPDAKPRTVGNFAGQLWGVSPWQFRRVTSLSCHENKRRRSPSDELRDRISTGRWTARSATHVLWSGYRRTSLERSSIKISSTR